MPSIASNGGGDVDIDGVVIVGVQRVLKRDLSFAPCALAELPEAVDLTCSAEASPTVPSHLDGITNKKIKRSHTPPPSEQDDSLKPVVTAADGTDESKDADAYLIPPSQIHVRDGSKAGNSSPTTGSRLMNIYSRRSRSSSPLDASATVLALPATSGEHLSTREIHLSSTSNGSYAAAPLDKGSVSPISILLDGKAAVETGFGSSERIINSLELHNDFAMDTPNASSETLTYNTEGGVSGISSRRNTRSANRLQAPQRNLITLTEQDIEDVENKQEYPTKRVTRLATKIKTMGLPSNAKELLHTGLLEGLSVKYAPSKFLRKQGGLRGVIQDGNILCFCDSCEGSKTISAFQFELHGGSSKKHPSNFIYLENGRSLHDILKECSTASLDTLDDVIRNAVCPIPQTELYSCEKCKESFHTPRFGKSTMFCNSCLQEDQHSRAPSSKKETHKNERELSPASEHSLKCTSSNKKFGKLTRKDLGLHKLVFLGGILPNGAEVGYYVRGQKLLDGLIQDGGIFCDCCKSVVSPSVFEAHAGCAQRRKPYNYIYTSNGVSLHELSVSLSKDRKLSTTETDDLCSICSDGGNLLLCDLCPRAFHKECVGLSAIPQGDYHCQYCLNLHHRDRALAHNDNAIAAGRVIGVDPIEQIFKRSIRIVEKPEMDVGGCCVLCRSHDFTKIKFGPRTVIFCDQCEREYHVGCLKAHKMAFLKELPEEEWFCSADCSRIYTHMKKLLCSGEETINDLYYNLIKKKLEEKGLNQYLPSSVRWRLLSGQTLSSDTELLLSKAVSIFHESFDPIVDMITGRDLIPAMVYGRMVSEQDYQGMYCAILMVDSFVVSAGILRVFGCEVAELPLVATHRESQGMGYFQALFSCIELLLRALRVKHFILPAAEEAKSIWISKFGFSTITPEEVSQYAKGARPTLFQGTSILHKPLPPV